MCIRDSLSRDRRLDDLDQLSRGLYLLLLPRTDDVLGDVLRETVLPIIPYNMEEFRLAVSVYNVLRRLCLPLVHPHIQRLSLIHI